MAGCWSGWFSTAGRRRCRSSRVTRRHSRRLRGSVDGMESSTDTRTPSQIAREAFRILFEDRDLSDPSRLWSETSVDHFLAAGQSVRGPEALAQWFRELLAAVPDFRMEILNA